MEELSAFRFLQVAREVHKNVQKIDSLLILSPILLYPGILFLSLFYLSIFFFENDYADKSCI